ncbi:MAG: TlpA family protein disulfide reductase [Bacteroidales bacterium]|nr:TlpA family protein disulfide reductase [Bacteroidales bacterium]
MKKTLILLVSALLSISLLAQEAEEPSNILLLGQEMPDFTITTMDGKAFSSDNLSGKTVLINFFATWCGPCLRELPFVQKEIWNKYKDNEDFLLLIISREEKPEKVNPFVKEKQYIMPFYSDIDRSCYSQFAEKYIPRNYLFDKSGKLIYQSKGFKADEFKLLLTNLAEQLN